MRLSTRLNFAAVLVSAAIVVAASGRAAPVTVSIAVPEPARTEDFRMGEWCRPDGATLTMNSSSLLLDGKPWTPVMGEFHFSRYPENEWREELLKMKAGGVDIVATYVFWIHHEEIEGQFDWNGCRNLRRFVELSGEAGLKVIVRCGPWDHGEVRNGGLPDWLLKKGWRTRSNDTNFLAKVKILYGEIAGQLRGLLWKDGGPVIGIQLDNEFHGPAEYLLTLKRLAREAGLDVPIYTRTGWPALTTPMPFGEIVPLYGVYAEGFWDRELTSMPGRYWAGFHFSTLRTDANIANEILGRGDAKDPADVARYPYLTCEIGGGMMSSYHRRILVDPADIDSTTLVKLGSGSTSPGYYMYHGGVNPEGRLSTLQESQATGYANDMPVKNYDFQAPLGQYGQIRPQYHALRRLHLFLRDFGASLAAMSTAMPDQRPGGKEDTNTLRWCVRSDGNAGFVFVNNHERSRELPAKKDVQFAIRLPAGSVTFPDQAVTIPAGVRFFWPFNFDLGHRLKLAWATAQPVCAIDDGKTRTVFFFKVADMPADFAFVPAGVQLDPDPSETIRRGADGTFVHRVNPGRDAAIRFGTPDGGIIQIVLLSDADSLALWKSKWQGRERVFLTEAGLVCDASSVRLSSTDPMKLNVEVFPGPENVKANGELISAVPDGVFTRFKPQTPKLREFKVAFEPVQSAGPAREIPLGKGKQPVATAPENDDFEKAAVWRIKLPADLDLASDPLLQLDYVGDVGRVTLNGKLITDDFYNGAAWEIGLRRHAPEIVNGDLRVAILPLRRDAPIYLAKDARPDFGAATSVASLRGVKIVPRYQVELTANSDGTFTGKP
jgi:hypothetical protein